MKIESVTWKQNVPHRGIDAERAHQALENIRKSHSGLTDDAIVSAARPKNHTLHEWFEWDDSVAANEHRRTQARSLIRSIEVVYAESPDLKLRAYEVQRKSRPSETQRTIYSTTEEVMQDPESRDRLIAAAIRNLMDVRRRFRALHELDQVWDAFDRAVDDMAKA